MEQQISNNEILEQLKQIRIDINLIKERLPEESDDELFEQVKDSLEDAKAGRIKRVA